MPPREILLPYGKRMMPLLVPEENLGAVLLPKSPPAAGPIDEGGIVRRALERPIGAPRLRELARGRNRVCIIASDITRPVPTCKLLPPILAELGEAGIEDGRIEIVFGLGSHRRHTGEEMKRLVGEEVFHRFRCRDHDPGDCVSLGATKHGGIPVEIARAVAEADFRICTGNIDLHYFAGYTGGVKAIMPGVSSRDSIAATHRMMLDPRSVAGTLETNPAREAIEEVGGMVGVDFLLNVVLDEKKRILAAFAGDARLAHRAGCAFLDTIAKVEIEDQAEIVVSSAGGYPKDINLYQAQKALDNAKHAAKEGGTIVLVAECPEGLGEETFKDWMFSSARPGEILERARREFSLGGHKAVAIAMLLQSAKVILVSALGRAIAERLFFAHADGAQDGLAQALAGQNPGARVHVMPYGGAVLPQLRAMK